MENKKNSNSKERGQRLQLRDTIIFSLFSPFGNFCTSSTVEIFIAQVASQAACICSTFFCTIIGRHSLI